MLELFTLNNVLYILAALYGSVLAIYLFIKGAGISSKYFAYFIIALVIWILCNFFADISTTEEALMFWARSSIVGPVFAVPLFIFFTYTFPVNAIKEKGKHFIITLLLTTLPFLLFVPTKYNVAKVGFTEFGVDYEPGLLYVVFGFYFVIGFVWGIARLFHQFVTLKGSLRQQVLYIMLGLGSTLVIGLFFSLILPLMGYSGSEVTIFGPISTLIFISSAFFVLYKYKLFGASFVFNKIVGILFIGIVPVVSFYAAYGLNILIWNGIWGIGPILLGLFLSFGFYSLYSWFIKKLEGGSSLSLFGENKFRIIKDNLQNEIAYETKYDTIVEKMYKAIEEIYSPEFIELKKIDGSDATFFPAGRVPKGLKIFHQVISIDELVFALEAQIENKYIGNRDTTKSLVKLLTEKSIHLVVPLYEKEGVSTVLLLGARGNNMIYYFEDIDFLSTMISGVASNLMRASLYKESQTFNATLQQRIDEATADLQQKNTDLKRLRDRERDMMDIMGHELRTPLTIIKMTLGLLKTKAEKLNAKFEKDEFDIYYIRMKEAIEREIRLLETMLSSTKLDANRMEIHLEKVDFLPMIKDAMLAQQEKAEEKGLKFVFDDPEIPIEVFADRVRLPEVIDNLVSNAVKYTEEGHVKIKIDTDSHANYILVAVSDTGIGIPEDALPHLGTKFFRVQQHLEKVHREAERKASIVRPGGTGLGLHVSYGLTEMMGGKILVESEIGKGSTFTIKIPKFIDQQEVDFREDGRDAFARMGLTKNGAKATKKVKKSTAKTGSKMTKERVKRGEKDSHLSVVELLAQDQEE